MSVEGWFLGPESCIAVEIGLVTKVTQGSRIIKNAAPLAFRPHYRLMDQLGQGGRGVFTKLKIPARVEVLHVTRVSAVLSLPKENAPLVSCAEWC